MKKLLLILMIGMCLISLITASDLGTFKQNECVELYQFCDDCSYVNVTSIKSPNSSISYVGAQMTKTNSDFNYTFCSTSSVGEYSYTTCGDKGGTYICESINFEVTGSGFSNTLGFYIIILILSLGIVIFGISISDAPITILGSFGLYFLGLWILFNGIDNLKDPVYTWAIGIIILGLASYISIKSAYELIID